MLTDRYITSQKEIEKVTILIGKVTDQILNHLDDNEFYDNELLLNNEMITALKGIEVCLSVNMDQQLIGEINDLMNCYCNITDYIQNRRDDSRAEKFALLVSMTQEKIEKMKSSVFARKKSIMMLVGNLQEYALYDLMYAIQLSKKIHAVKILDYDLSLESLGIVEKRIETGELNITISDFYIDGYNLDTRACTPASLTNIYCSIYQIGETPDMPYDMVWMLHAYDGNNIDDIEKYMIDTKEYARFVLLNILAPVRDKAKSDMKLLGMLEQYGKCIVFSNENRYFYLVDRKPEPYQGKVGIYVVTHKKFLPPNNPMYIPIHAGREGKESLGYQGDDQGDNISHLNPYINELTALYWIWKNDSEHKYIGINHYRRYFNWQGLSNVETLLEEETVLKILKEYDVIISEPLFFYPISIEYQLREMFGQSKGIDEAILITRRKIVQIQPEYEKYFDKIMEGHNFICCNIFIASREIVGEYCAWLFSFLPEAVSEWIASCMNETYYEYPREMGFMAERLLSVWLLGKKYRVKALHGVATMKYCVTEE